MKVIRDPQWNGLFMIPIFQQYGIKRCNVDGCENKPSTVITGCPTNDGDTCDFALCEHHYLESKESGTINYKLTFDQA